MRSNYRRVVFAVLAATFRPRTYHVKVVRFFIPRRRTLREPSAAAFQSEPATVPPTQRRFPLLSRQQTLYGNNSPCGLTRSVR